MHVGLTNLLVDQQPLKLNEGLTPIFDVMYSANRPHPLQLLHTDAGTLHPCGEVDRLAHAAATHVRCQPWTLLGCSSCVHNQGSTLIRKHKLGLAGKGARELGHVLVHLLDVGAGALYHEVVHGPAIVRHLRRTRQHALGVGQEHPADRRTVRLD